MKMQKVLIQKLLVGILLLSLAAGVTVLIKESFDTQDPEAALPLITVDCNGLVITDVYRAGYNWSFFTTVENKQAPSLAPEDLPIIPVDVPAGVPVSITFTKKPSTLRVWRAEGRYSSDFTELSGEEAGEFTTPVTVGTYVYKVNATWRRGEVQYYFALNVAQQ